MRVNSIIEADKKLLSGITYPASVCRLANTYIQDIVKFPIPVFIKDNGILIDSSKLLAVCTGISFDGAVFTAEIQDTDELAKIVTNPDDWYVEMPIRGNKHSLTKEVTQFCYMQAYLVLNRRSSYKEEWSGSRTYTGAV